VLAQKKVTDFGYSENIKLKIGHQLFSKRDFYFIKCGSNWQNLSDFQTFLVIFHVFQVVEHTSDSFKKRLHSKNEIFQKILKIPFLVNFCQF
jgi:hypothetical protein